MKSILYSILLAFAFCHPQAHPFLRHENTQAPIHLTLGNKVSADNTVGLVPEDRMYVTNGKMHETFSYNQLTEETPDSFGNIVKSQKNWVRTPSNVYSTSDSITTFNGHINDESHFNKDKKTKYRNLRE